MKRKRWDGQACVLDLRMYVSRPERLTTEGPRRAYDVGLSNISLRHEVVWVNLHHRVDEHACAALVDSGDAATELVRERIEVKRTRRNPSVTHTEQLTRVRSETQQSSANLTVSSTQCLDRTGEYVPGPTVSVTCETP